MAANLRTKPIDRRRLSREDRASYKPAPRAKALAKAKSHINAVNARETKPINTTKRRPGTGGFSQGIGIQQARVAEKGAELRRAKSLRPEAAISPDIYKQLAK